MLALVEKTFKRLSLFRVRGVKSSLIPGPIYDSPDGKQNGKCDELIGKIYRFEGLAFEDGHGGAEQPLMLGPSGLPPGTTLPAVIMCSVGHLVILHKASLSEGSGRHVTDRKKKIDASQM